jgi:hypothetical protein
MKNVKKLSTTVAMINAAVLLAGMGAMSVSSPAFAVAIPDPTPLEEILSAVALDKCLDKYPDGWSRAACFLILLDPPVSGVSNIEYQARFDPNELEIAPVPLFFGDFGLNGVYIPVVEAVIGGVQPLEPDPVFDVNDALSPRLNTSASFLVDNVIGELSLSFDLSANPIPLNTPAQNFFGFFAQRKTGDVKGVEYFSTAGSYDYSQVSLSCRLVDDQPIGCGSDHPVIGWNVVPEPSTCALLISGIALLGTMVRRRSGIC